MERSSAFLVPGLKERAFVPGEGVPKVNGSSGDPYFVGKATWKFKLPDAREKTHVPLRVLTHAADGTRAPDARGAPS